MPRKRTDLSRNTRNAKRKKLAKKKLEKRLGEANRPVFLRAAATPESSQLSEEYHAGYLASQTATESFEETRQKLQEQVDNQKNIEVTNTPRIENVRTMMHQEKSFSSRNICDTKNTAEYDLASDNHGLITIGQMNNQSRFCKVLKSKEDIPRIFCSEDRVRKALLTRNMNPQSEMMNLRVANATKTPSGINIRPTYVSSVLNKKLLLVTSPSNSTRPKIPNDKLETWETKTQNTINSGKQTKSLVSSLESTSGKTEESTTMSSQTKKNLFENSSKTYRKEPLIYRDFQNISTGETGFQNLPQSTSEIAFRNDTNIYNQSEQEMNNKKKSFFNEKSMLTDSKYVELAKNKIGGIMHNPNKSSDAGDGDLNANLVRSREKQEKPQKSATYLTKENEYFEKVHKIHLHNNIRENVLTKMQNRNSTSTSQPPTVHIISNIKPQCASNYVQPKSTREVKLKDIKKLNLQKSRILYTAENNEKNKKTHSGPLFYHLFNPDKSAAIPNYKFQQPLLYGQSGTATRRNGDVRGRCKLIVPKQIILHSGKRADRTQQEHVVRSRVLSNDARKFQNSLKVSNYIPFSPYQQQNFQVQSSRAVSVGHAKTYQNLSKVPSFDSFRPRLQQNYQVQYNSGRFQIGAQKHQNSLEVSNFGLISTSQKQRHQVRPNIANTENIPILKIRDNKPDTSNQRKSEATDTIKRKKLSDNPESNQNNNHKSNASEQRTSGSTSTFKRREFSTSSPNTQYGNNKQNASSQYTFIDPDTVKSHKLTVNCENNQNNNSYASEQRNLEATNMIKSQMLPVTFKNTQYENNNPRGSGQHDSETTGTIKRQKLPGSPQNNHKKQQEENTDSYKIKVAKETFTKISELLINISEMLSTEFECPTELELSLPAWKAELGMCMVSAEKIKVEISQQEKEKEMTCLE